MIDFYRDKLGDLSSIITEDVDIPEPDLMQFKNSDIALNMLLKHIKNRSKVSLLADVDMDGIGSAYVVYHFLSALGLSGCIKPCINKDRVHGVSEKHINYINNAVKPDLFIIVDSSSNDIDYISKMSCDVLVIDHHNLKLDQEGFGNTLSGSYCIISNILSNLQADMSGCQVCYEFFRFVEHKLNLSDSNSILKNQLLYQIVGVTLLSDAVILNNKRNQWYIQNTLCNFNINETLKIILKNLNKYEKYLTKSFIQFKLVPLFNKAIRAGNSSLALDIFLNRPEDCNSLLEFSKLQDLVLDTNFNNYQIIDNVTFSNLDNTYTNANYAGVLAQRLVNETNRSSIAFKKVDGFYSGSFRGLCAGLDYRSALDSVGIQSQGHNTAFGIKFTYDKLDVIKSTIMDLEKDYKQSYFMSIACDGGDFRLNTFNELILNRNLLKLSYANKNLSSSEQLLVKLPKSLLVNTSKSVKYSTYSLGDFSCVSFENELTDYVILYCEYTTEVRLFIRNISNGF